MNMARFLRIFAWIGLVFFLSVAASAQSSVSNLSQEWVVELGETYKDGFEITNISEEPVTVELYQFDYLFSCDGYSSFPPAGELPRSNASWIRLDYSSPYLTIPAKSSKTVSYTIQIPDDPNLVGTYWSVVKVTPSAGRLVTPQEGVAIRQVIEYAIQIVTHIGDTGIRDIRILDSKLLYEGEGAILKIDLENTGERWLRPEAWTELYDENGAVVGPFESPRKRIYPGCSVRHRFPLAGIPGGKYKALVVFDNGDEYVWGAQYDLEL